MCYLRSLLLLFAACLLPLHALAATCTVYQKVDGSYTSSAEAACQSFLPTYRQTYPPPMVVTYKGTFGTPPTRCDYQVRGEAGNLVASPSNALNYTQRDCDDRCKNKAATSEIVNITAGWARSGAHTTPSQEWVYTYRLPPSGTAKFCSADGCEQSIDANEPCADCLSYTSQVPGANGLYRKSVDFRGHYSGAACDPGKSEIPTDRLSPDDSKDPPCPGYVGEVNGVKGCYGDASKPITPVPGEMPKAPQDNGNPAAGAKPGSGEGSGTGGSGRTPSQGTGGSAGGPAGAAAGGTGSGTKPNGTTDKPGEGKEQAACGAPGQPKCQIDETGTPNGSDSKDKLLDAVNKAADEKKAAIEDASKLKADGWTFTFALPSGCSALTLAGYQIPGQGAFSLDMCRWQPMIHDIMSMVWLICTVWGCINMVGAAQRGS